MYRAIYDAIYGFVDFFIKEFVKELIGAFFSIKFPINLLRFIFWVSIYICCNIFYVIMKLHGKILTRIISYINKSLIVHQITQRPLLKCSALNNKNGSKNIRVLEVDLITLKTNTEIYRVIRVLSGSKWTWIMLICVPIVRFVIPVRNDNVKKVDVEKNENARRENLKAVEDFKDENLKRNDDLMENSRKKEEFNWNEIKLKNVVVFSDELLNEIIPKYLLFYKLQIIEREEQDYNINITRNGTIKNEMFINKRKILQETEHHHHHNQINQWQQRQRHHNQPYQYNREIINLDYFNLSFLIGILLYGIIIYFFILFDVCLYCILLGNLLVIICILIPDFT